MTSVIFRGCADVVITRNIITMVPSSKGVGVKKVFNLGMETAGYTCAFTREIRQGGWVA